MNDDLSNERTRARQYEMKLALARTGLGQHILSELPEPRLSQATCQWRARDLRARTQNRAYKMLKRRKRAMRFFVTWVQPHELSHDLPFRYGASSFLSTFESACRESGAYDVAGAAEADFDVVAGGWRATAHAVINAEADCDSRAVSAILADLLRSNPARDPSVHRPLQVKPLTDLSGALSYTFKSIAVLSTTQRSSWVDDQGHKRTTKQKLRTQQLQQLLRQTIRDGVEDRILLASFKEVQS